MNEKLKKALAELENDNAKELHAQVSTHRFSRDFNRRAMAVCRGETATVHRKPVFRRLPLWAAVLLIFLLCALVTGCAVAVYKYLTRYIPGYGITDIQNNVSLYATEEGFTVGDMQIETVLYVGDKDGGTLTIWASGPLLGGWENLGWMETPIFTVESGGMIYNAPPVSASTNEETGRYQCEVSNIQYDKNIILARGGEKVKIDMVDQTDCGYTVAKWGEYDGIIVKVLPLYANNRVVFMETEGIPDASNVSATITMYDALGNRVSSGSGWNEENGFLLQMPNSLPGNIERIEIDSLRVTVPASGTYSIPIPQNDTSVDTDIPLLDTDIFSERITQIRRDGDEIYITTKIDAHKYQPLTDLSIDYNASDAFVDLYSSVGIDVFTYRLTLKGDAESVIFTPYSYTYIISNGNEPLCSIEIQ